MYIKFLQLLSVVCEKGSLDVCINLMAAFLLSLVSLEIDGDLLRGLRCGCKNFTFFSFVC